MGEKAKIDSVSATRGIMHRLREFIRHKNLSMHKFGEMTNIATGGISRAINAEGKYSMGIDKFMNIFTIFPDLNPKWLLFGESPMIHEKGTVISEETYRDLVEQNEELVKEITRLKAKQEAYQEIFSMFTLHKDFGEPENS